MRKERIFPALILKVVLQVVVLAITIYGVVSVVKSVSERREQAHCSCLGNQPYINTKYHNGRCLVNVLSYEDIDIAETIFVAQEYCR